MRTATSISGRRHGRWVLILCFAAVFLAINALVLWNIYGTWVYGTPDCR